MADPKARHFRINKKYFFGEYKLIERVIIGYKCRVSKQQSFLITYSERVHQVLVFIGLPHVAITNYHRIVSLGACTPRKLFFVFPKMPVLMPSASFFPMHLPFVNYMVHCLYLATISINRSFVQWTMQKIDPIYSN